MVFFGDDTRSANLLCIFSRLDNDTSFRVQQAKWSWQNRVDGKDPLLSWKKMKANGDIDDVYDVSSV